MFALIVPLGGSGGMMPDNSLPTPPVYPGHGLPGGPVYPSNGLPPSVWPNPPPGAPPEATHPIQPVPGGPAQLPVLPAPPTLPPGVIWPPLPPGMPAGKLLVAIFISGIGTRWAVIDTTLTPGTPLPPAAAPKA